MPTNEAEAQVDPGVTDSQAVLAPIRARNNLSYFIKMRTFIGNHVFSFHLKDTSHALLVLPDRKQTPPGLILRPHKHETSYSTPNRIIKEVTAQPSEQRNWSHCVPAMVFLHVQEKPSSSLQ